MPGSKHAWPNSAACWSPAMPLIGIPRHAAAIGGDAEPTARRDAPRAAPTSGRASSSHSSSGPRRLDDVEQHRAAGVGDVGGVHLAAGEVPHQPGVDRAEREVGVDRDVALGSSHSNFVPQKYGSSTSPVRSRTRSQVSGRGELVAARRGAAVLPDDRVPYGSPVVRSQATTVSRWLVMPIAATCSRPTVRRPRRASPSPPPRSRRRRARPTRAGEALGELPVRRPPPGGRRRTPPGCARRSCRRRSRSRTRRRCPRSRR